MELKITFKNYALVPNGEYNLHDGTIFFIKGHNNKGKSTFLNALKSIMEVKDEKVDPTTYGETEGEIICSIPGADGKQYQVRYDFTSDGKKRFRIIDENGRSIQTVGAMRSVFAYNHISATDWLEMSKSEGGRQKQREVLINLMSDSERKRLQEIDQAIDTRKGTDFALRTQKNAEYDAIKKVNTQFALTDDEAKLLNNEENAKRTFADLKTSQAKHQSILDNSKVNLEKLANARHIRTVENEAYEKYVQSQDALIKDLEDRLVAAKKEKMERTKTYNENKDVIIETITTLEKEVDEKTINASKDILEDRENNGTIIPGLNTRISNGEKILKSIEAIKTKKETFDKNNETLQALYHEIDGLNAGIENKRKEKSEIIKNSKNIPDRWGFEDDYLTYDGIPFLPTEISTSLSLRAVTDLMVSINKSPVMIMGDAESLGFEVLEELVEIAKEHNRIMVFAEHDRTMDDVELICYDELDIPETKPVVAKKVTGKIVEPKKNESNEPTDETPNGTALF